MDSIFDGSGTTADNFIPYTGNYSINPSSSSSSGSGSSGGSGLGALGSAWGLGLDTLGLGFGAYTGLKSLSLANKEFKLNKRIATQNFNNETQQYNTNLQHTANLRSSMLGTGGAGSQAAQDYYNQNKLQGV